MWFSDDTASYARFPLHVVLLHNNQDLPYRQEQRRRPDHSPSCALCGGSVSPSPSRTRLLMAPLTPARIVTIQLRSPYLQSAASQLLSSEIFGKSADRCSRFGTHCPPFANFYDSHNQARRRGAIPCRGFASCTTEQNPRRSPGEARPTVQLENNKSGNGMGQWRGEPKEKVEMKELRRELEDKEKGLVAKVVEEINGGEEDDDV